MSRGGLGTGSGDGRTGGRADGADGRTGGRADGARGSGGYFVACAPQTTGYRVSCLRHEEWGNLLLCYWQASQVPPLRMASMEHAVFSASVNSLAGRRSWFALSMALRLRVRR
ncbi:MAG: hypothetical protein RIS92_717 [Verrucomicrobiota bacterium]